MKKHSLLTAYGLKWNPFLSDVPLDGLVVTPRIASFCHRLESLVTDGGYAMITGEPGTGKSALMRIVEERLSNIRDLVVCQFTRPQSRIADFYRELGSHFGMSIATNNRWGGYKALREKWLHHIDSTGVRPVIMIDEAQRMANETMTELAQLASTLFDSRMVLTIILSGDLRLNDRFRDPDLFPIGTRMRTRYLSEPATAEELIDLLVGRLERAGNATLMTKELIATLADHSAGNPRVLLNTADELFAKAAERNAAQIDEKLFLETYGRHEQKRQRRERTKA
jgi:type II secretory pathway predicted ATPase ExeA